MKFSCPFCLFILYLVNQQNHFTDWKASHSIDICTYILSILLWQFEHFLVKYTYLQQTFVRFLILLPILKKRKKIWFPYLNHPKGRWTAWKSQGGWESKEVSIISPLVEMGLIDMPKSRRGHFVLKWGFMQTFPGNQDATLK